MTIPKDMYDSDGNLLLYPVEGVHIVALKTKSQKGDIPKLLTAATNQDDSAGSNNDKPTKENDKKQKAQEDVSPKGLLLSYVIELVDNAAISGNSKLTERTAR